MPGGTLGRLFERGAWRPGDPSSAERGRTLERCSPRLPNDRRRRRPTVATSEGRRSCAQYGRSRPCSGGTLADGPRRARGAANRRARARAARARRRSPRRHDERRQQPHRRRAGRVDARAAARAARGATSSGASAADVELEGEHQPAAAHVGTPRQLGQPGAQALAELAHARQQRRVVERRRAPRAPPRPRPGRRRTSSRGRRARRRRPAAAPVTSAPIGRPPPSALAVVSASGTTPVCS